jgi:hypothetical protein
MYKAYSFEYNDKTHYLLPTVHIDYSLLNDDIIKFIKQIIDNVDTCFFETEANKAIEMGKKIKIPKITKETTIEKIYSEKDINKIKTIIKKLFNIDIPKTHIEKQLLIKIRKPMEIISSYDNNKKKSLTDIQTKHKYFDVFIENILANKKKIIALDNMKELTKQFTPKFYEDITNLLIAKPPKISKIEKNFKESIKLINKWIAKFTTNTSMKLNIGNIGVDVLNETEERNVEWLKKIFDYLDKNPTKNIAIIVGGAHIFGFDEKNKKTGKTLPNLLSKMKNVKNVNYSTL